MREVMKELAVLSMDAPLVEGEDSGTWCHLRSGNSNPDEDLLHQSLHFSEIEPGTLTPREADVIRLWSWWPTLNVEEIGETFWFNTLERVRPD
jgi:DNA-directed RNA polymerase sigma subunit (sigma70/sigma32)